MLLGLSFQVSLAQLVRHYQGIELAKTDSFTEWARRPLDARQLEYAANDVRYLPNIYDSMIDELTGSGRIAWIKEDFERMAQAAAEEAEPASSWLKVKRANSLTARQLATLKEVAAWRELTAQRRNLPRKWILSDELLIEVARNDPGDPESLFRIRGMRDRLGQLWARELLSVVIKARDLPPVRWPKSRRGWAKKIDQPAVLDLMNALVHVRACELHIAAPYLAPVSELKILAAGEDTGLELLNGWRRELIGEELKALLEGRLALCVFDGDIKVVPVSQ
jgi:ribonuclease D